MSAFRPKRFFLHLLTAVSLWLLLAGQSAVDLSAVNQLLDDKQQVLDSAAEEVKSGELFDEELIKLRQSLEATRSELQGAVPTVRPELEDLKRDLEELGPAPTRDEPPEADMIAEQRKRLNARLAELDAVLRRIDLSTARVSRLLEEISSLRRSRFAQRILSRGPSVFSASLWENAAVNFHVWRDLMLAIGRMENTSKAFGVAFQHAGPSLLFFLLLGGALILAFYAAVYHRWRVRLEAEHIITHRAITPEARTMRAGLVLTVWGVMPSLLLYLLYLFARSESLVVEPLKTLLGPLGGSLFILLFGLSVINGLLAPYRRDWRVIPLSDHNAGVIASLWALALLVFAVDGFFFRTVEQFAMALDLEVAEGFLASSLSALLIFTSLLPVWWRAPKPVPGIDSEPTEGEKLPGALWPRVRVVIAFFALLVPLFALLGYVPLARFLIAQIIVLALFVGIFWIVHYAVRNALEVDVVSQLLNEEHEEEGGQSLSSAGGIFRFWLSVAIDAALLLFLASVYLTHLRVVSIDIRELLYQALFGFKVGEITISIAEIFYAVALFLVVLLATRLFQRFLSNRVFPKTRLDTGVQHSLRVMTGYVGIFIAAFVGISAIGFDLSNLAIIAGALSVGIGFGLQSIVSNFVSGLILLIERPIKVGDWIIVGADEGYVKNIRVRSTEIETFDRSSVIIPNSELISGRVVNWTLKDKNGRMRLPVGVSYSSDVEKVREILLKCAEEQKALLKYPKPQVLFMGFGNSSLDFELRGFLRNVEYVVAVSSELRFAILKAFREEGIEIPFPQQDLHLRDLDRLEKLLRGREGEQPGAPKEGGGGPPLPRPE